MPLVAVASDELRRTKPLRLSAMMFSLGEREISGYLERDRNVLLVQIDMNI